MKFKCGKLLLANSLTSVQKAVAQRSTIAALEGVLIDCKDGKIELCGYNTEMGITTSLQANTEREGKIVVNCHLLTEIIKKLPLDIVQVEVNENLVVKISAGQSHFELIGIDAKEFPELPKVPNEGGLKIPASTLRSMIKQTIFAVADTDSKPVHTGTLFDAKEKSLTLVSVDGYRLAMRTETIDEDMELKFVVPGKTLKEILRLLSNGNEDEQTVEIFAGTKHIVFYIDEYKIVSRLLDGEFLDYKAAVPQTSGSKVKLSTSDLIDSIERVSLLITDRLKSPVKCTFSKDYTKLSCTTLIGKSSDEISSSSDIKDDIETAFNNKYMLDALKNTDSDEIEIEVSGPLSPIKIIPRQGNSFLFLVLPVRVKS